MLLFYVNFFLISVFNYSCSVIYFFFRPFIIVFHYLSLLCLTAKAHVYRHWAPHIQFWLHREKRTLSLQRPTRT